MAISYKPPWETYRKNGEDVPILQNHHIVPSSRGGPKVGNLIKRMPSDMHWCWHRLFGNLKPSEIITVILMFFCRPGDFVAWKRYIPDGESPPEVFTPDQIILEMMNLIFSKYWVPSDELMGKLEERRTWALERREKRKK